MADMLGRENVQAGNVTEIADAIDVEVETDVSALATTAQLNATEAAIGALLNSTVSTQTTGAAAAADTAILAANPLRKNFAVYNGGTTILNLHVAAGAASAASFYKVQPQGFYDNQGERWTGPVRGWWDGAPAGNWIAREVT